MVTNTTRAGTTKGAVMFDPEARGAKATLLWGTAAVFMLVLFGFELVLPQDRVLWLIFDVMVLIGVVCTVRAAVFLGIISALLVLVWVLWLIDTNSLQPHDLLFMFLLPLASVPMSAMRQSIASRRLLNRRVTNWRMMPIHQLPDVLDYLGKSANCKQILTAELRTTDLGFWRSLLGADDGRERLTALQDVLVALIAKDGWAFLDYENARCRVLLPDMTSEHWRERFRANVDAVPHVSISCGEVETVDIRGLDRILDAERGAATVTGARSRLQYRRHGT